MALNKIKPLNFKHLKALDKEQLIPDGGNLYVRVRALSDGGACQSALKSIHLTASNNVQQLNKVIPFSAPFYAA